MDSHSYHQHGDRGLHSHTDTAADSVCPRKQHHKLQQWMEGGMRQWEDSSIMISSPAWQLSPVQPGSQSHDPSCGEHVPLPLQRQLLEHSSPQCPCGHTAKGGNLEHAVRSCVCTNGSLSHLVHSFHHRNQEDTFLSPQCHLALYTDIVCVPLRAPTQCK